MKAHEALDSDDQAVADNAAEILRTMARIVDDMRHLCHMVESPAWKGHHGWHDDFWYAHRNRWQARFTEESGGAPVEDWLDHQWAESPNAGATWPKEALIRLAKDVMQP